MKRYIYILFSLLGLLFLFALPVVALAQTKITISTVIPGSNPATTGSGAPGAFIANFYQFALIIGGVLAFAVIVYGGIRYMTSAGNPSGQSDAKEWIEGALLGLLLLAGAYLILSVVNPQLLNLNLPGLTAVNLSSIVPAGGSGGTTGAASGGGTVAGSQAQTEFNASGVAIKSGASVAGMQQGTISDIDNLATQCAQADGGASCNVTITAGTDGDHASGLCSHANGYKADIRSTNQSLNSFITSLPKGPVRSDGAQLYSYGGGTIADERNLPGIDPHWDLSASCP